MSTKTTTRRKFPRWAAYTIGGVFLVGFIGNLIDPVEPAPQTPAAVTTPAPEVTVAEPVVDPVPVPAPDPLSVLQVELAGEAWADQVTGVSRDGQLVVVETTLTDPRRESSAEGMIAGTVCYAAERAFGEDQTVRVLEADGTTFATNQLGECAQH